MSTEETERVINVRAMCESIVKIGSRPDTENGKRWKDVQSLAARVIELLDGGQP